jgi:hypothetical protein
MTGAVRRRHRNRPAAWLIAALAANFGVALDLMEPLSDLTVSRT